MSAEARDEMVRRQIERRGIRDERLLAALRSVPREEFVPEALRAYAFEDRALPLEFGQSISQPYIVALMVDALRIERGDRVLEVGAGSGYAAAVLATLAREVVTVERIPTLALRAGERLRTLGYGNVEVICGDGSLGVPERCPFDAILVSAGAPDVPPALAAQLADGGRLVCPVGADPRVQTLVRWTRRADGTFQQEGLGGVAFVPLLGVQGWEEDAAGDRFGSGER